MPFRDVLGHAAVIANLRAALIRDCLPHALLFAGRLGIGKHTVARALLAARYCERRRDGDACGACPECRRIAQNEHNDVILLGRERGKRDIGIAAIREVQGALHLASTSGRGRATILDGAERMTEEAQNAFLKTLEEPPAKAVIVLVSSAVDRLLPTIRSRCAVHRFAPLTTSEMEVFVARMSNTRSSVPVTVARGSPGHWSEITKPPHPEARALVLDLLLDPALSPFAFAMRMQELALTEEEEPEDVAPVDPAGTLSAEEEEVVSDSSEIGRQRLEQWLLLLEWALRDVLVLAMNRGSAHRNAHLVHADKEVDFSRLAGSVPAEVFFPLLDSIERARGDLHRNVDRALTLETLAIELRSRLKYTRGPRSTSTSR